MAGVALRDERRAVRGGRQPRVDDRGGYVTASTTVPRPRPDASMVLLDEVMRRPLDPGYAEAAARRASGLAPHRGPARRAALLVAAALLGGGTVAAAAQLRAPGDDVVSSQTILEDQIVERREAVDDLVALVQSSTTEIESLQSSALGEQYPALLEAALRDGAAAGTSAVTGPGLVITLNDAVPLLGESDAAARVQDYDVQVVVNALWASGAQAVSVNGHRLTSTSAIRSAGEAILVDLVGLSHPYTIEAIGDPDTLPAYFARSLGQEHIVVLGSRYGITSSVSQEDSLALRAGRTPDLVDASRASARDGSESAESTSTRDEDVHGSTTAGGGPR